MKTRFKIFLKVQIMCLLSREGLHLFDKYKNKHSLLSSSMNTCSILHENFMKLRIWHNLYFQHNDLSLLLESSKKFSASEQPFDTKWLHPFWFSSWWKALYRHWKKNSLRDCFYLLSSFNFSQVLSVSNKLEYECCIKCTPSLRNILDFRQCSSP